MVCPHYTPLCTNISSSKEDNSIPPTHISPHTFYNRDTQKVQQILPSFLIILKNPEFSSADGPSSDQLPCRISQCYTIAWYTDHAGTWKRERSMLLVAECGTRGVGLFRSLNQNEIRSYGTRNIFQEIAYVVIYKYVTCKITCVSYLGSRIFLFLTFDDLMVPNTMNM